MAARYAATEGIARQRRRVWIETYQCVPCGAYVGGIARQRRRVWIETITLVTVMAGVFGSPVSDDGCGLKLDAPVTEIERYKGIARQRRRVWIETAPAVAASVTAKGSPVSDDGCGLKPGYSIQPPLGLADRPSATTGVD